MRAVGVDFGSKRIGIAVGESSPFATRARNSLAASGTLSKDAEAIGKIAREEEAELIVIGLPLDKEGNLTKMAKVCIQLVARLQDLGFRVETANEALTSERSEAALRAEYGKRRVRELVDGESARHILEEFFQHQA